MSLKHGESRFSRKTASCSSCNLFNICIPQGLDKENIDKLDTLIRRPLPIHRGEHIFRAGDQFRSIYAIHSGTAKAYQLSDHCEEQIIGFYLPGEILGFNSIEKEKYTCSAVALETSSYCEIPFSQVEEICRKIPELQRHIFRLMSREISFNNDMMLSICSKNAQEKLATFLVSLSNRFQHRGYSAREFKLTMSRQEIGIYLGLTIETVSRTFSRMQKEDIIKVDRKSVIINDLPTLRHMCSGMTPDVIPLFPVH